MKMVYDENSEFSRSILGIENQLQRGDSAYAQTLGSGPSKNEALSREFVHEQNRNGAELWCKRKLRAKQNVTNGW